MDSSGKENCRVREVECRSVLNKSGLADYAINCYAGCEHGCVYCYARFATRFSHPGEPWGSFVDVKANAPQVLAREVKRKRLGRVFLSSVCDGWQPGEAQYGLTRQCLEMLLRYRFPVSILTKNALAERDFDLLTSSKDKVEFGVTITTLDESLRQLVEPQSSPSVERLRVLQEAGRLGIRTYAFLGPLMPGLSDSDENVAQLLEAVKDAGIDYCYVDRLNPRFGVWPSLKGMLQKRFPHLVEVYRKLLYDVGAREEYSVRLIQSINALARRQGLDDKIVLCF
ncbi:MAG: hypothetical protein A2Z05_02050 [Chloroflexi bacterium RBG_16_60_22]|nr:MAG: hypothetical protein A2Z05_02050 [Chloroflexi bacterium RBG_16_60_22]